jgi:hypothetical protein
VIADLEISLTGMRSETFRRPECGQLRKEIEMDEGNGRWWPVAGRELPEWRIAEILYAVLGPRLCKELIERTTPIENDNDELSSILARLADVNGRCPSVLFEMAACLGLAYDHRDCKPHLDASPVQRIYRGHMWEVFKMWGPTVEMMLRQYGMEGPALELALSHDGHGLSDMPWPPRGVAYFRVDN